MNWRTLFWWWIIVVCLYQLPASLDDPNCIQAFGVIGGLLVTLFIIVMFIVTTVSGQWRQYRCRHKNFHLSFAIAYGSRSGVIHEPQQNPKIIHVGGCILTLIVQSRYGFRVKKIN